MTEAEINTEHHNAIVDDALEEVDNQIDKWGVQHHPDGTGTEVDRRLAETAKSLCDTAAKHGSVTWKDIMLEEVREAFAESDKALLRAELVQVIAVGISWIADIDGRPKEGEPGSREAHDRVYASTTGVANFHIDDAGVAYISEEALNDILLRAGFEELLP